jgi:hypothetical protein
MSIATVICTSDTRAALIGDAMRSVLPVTEQFILAHWAQGGDGTLDVARQVGGDRVQVFESPAIPDGNGFMARWRNLALGYASWSSASWALLLDTDMRVRLNGFDLLAYMQAQPASVNVVSLQDTDGENARPLLFRLPVSVRFDQEIHETLTGDQPGPVAPQVRFWEVKRSPELERKRLLSLIPGLEAQIAAEPDESRWHYHLADTLFQLGFYQKAADHFYDYTDLQLEPVQEAWGRFKQACCRARLLDYKRAWGMIRAGLALAPEMAELYWLGAVLSYAQKNLPESILWADLAIHWGMTDCGCKPTRSGPRVIAALYEAPWELMVRIFRDQDDQSQEAWARGWASKAREARIRYCEEGAE